MNFLPELRFRKEPKSLFLSLCFSPPIGHFSNFVIQVPCSKDLLQQVLCSSGILCIYFNFECHLTFSKGNQSQFIDPHAVQFRTTPKCIHHCWLVPFRIYFSFKSKHVLHLLTRSFELCQLKLHISLKFSTFAQYYV